MKKRAVGIIAGLIMAITLLVAAFWRMNAGGEFLPYTSYKALLEGGQVSEVTLGTGSALSGKLRDGTAFHTDNPRRENYKEELLDLGIVVNETSGLQVGQLIALAGVCLLVFGVYKYTKQKDLASGRAGIETLPDETAPPSVAFDDVAGNDEAKRALSDILAFIEQPELFERYGARMPRGVLFYGPPGTGKTLLARALAGEAGVPFFATSGADFVQLYVGAGAMKVRELFKKARKHEKAVIFIDEIDAVGKKRQNGDGGSDERDQTLNALLFEMSGFTPSEGIVVVAATNRIDTLDEALLRPGRFDRHIEVSLPDREARAAILQVHARNRPLSRSINMNHLAAETAFFSGAKLEAMLNEAAIYAARRNATCIEQQDMDRALHTILAGDAGDAKRAPQDRWTAAVHEAGHALVSCLVTPECQITRATILPGSRAGGYVVSIPPERIFFQKNDLRARMAVAMAGRAAEELVFGEENVSSGASNDIEKATEIAYMLCARFGMNATAGKLAYETLAQLSGGTISASEDMLATVRAEADAAYESARRVLGDNRAALDRLARALERYESLDGAEIHEVVYGRRAPVAQRGRTSA